MSFLNPVNEPVKRFKSTDAGAPQINYAARTAGDVKAVLKACLVTGYGSTASAGWSIVNEVDHVCEFVSPSAAMSDYRLVIDDTSTSSTTWYYRYMGGMVAPLGNKPVKSLSQITKTHENNGWQLFITDKGLMLVEIVYYTSISRMSARMTCFSQLKSSLKVSGGNNIAFFNMGHDGQLPHALDFYNPLKTHFVLNDHSKIAVVGSNLESLRVSRALNKSSADLVSAQYLSADDGGGVFFAGQLPPLFGVSIANAADIYTVSDATIDGRPAFRFTCGYSTTDTGQRISLASGFLIFLDYWEY